MDEYRNKYRVWIGNGMFYFTLGDVIDQVIDVPVYEGDEMQYTGIKDKEGKEIYEDDILRDEFTGKLFHCRWIKTLACFQLVLMEDPQTMFGMRISGGFTVVGNVHEMGA